MRVIKEVLPKPIGPLNKILLVHSMFNRITSSLFPQKADDQFVKEVVILFTIHSKYILLADGAAVILKSSSVAHAFKYRLLGVALL